MEMKRTKYEQETIILFNEAEAVADVYTHNQKLLRKLEGLEVKYPEQFKKLEEHKYIVPKNCVQIREPYSESRRRAASERAKAAGYRPPKRKASSRTE